MELLPNAPHDLPSKYREEQVYTIRVTKVFKGIYPLLQFTNNMSRARSYSHMRVFRAKLYTPSIMSTCRVNLKTGRIYLLGGKLDYNRLYVNSCSWISNWKAMTRRERKNLKWHFGRNCRKCIIQKCYGPRGCRSGAKMACNYDWAAPSYVTNCRTKYQYCKFDHITRSCTWYKTSEFNACINTIQKKSKMQRLNVGD